jgi:hypothetical protein
VPVARSPAASMPEPDPPEVDVPEADPQEPVEAPEPVEGAEADEGAEAETRTASRVGPRQLSLFGVEARPESPLDLEGLLAGAGQVVRMGGTARVSIVVDARWRAIVLRQECAQRGLAAGWEPSTVDGHFGFRTAYSSALAPLGRAWLRGAVKFPRTGFSLDGGRVRLWVIAGGTPDGSSGYLLRLDRGMEEQAWAVVGSVLVTLGLPAALLVSRAGGPAYRIVGRRRIARLAELVGEAPPGVPPGLWPG